MSNELARSLLVIVIAGLNIAVGVLQRIDRARRKLVLAPGADPPIRSTPATRVLSGLMCAALVVVLALLLL